MRACTASSWAASSVCWSCWSCIGARRIRCARSRAGWCEPELLLLDEPHAHLDPAAIALVQPLIGPSSKRTRVICSHDPAGGLAEADLVLGLRGGRAALSESAGRVGVGEIAELYR